jgi:hypothetical protein
VVRLKGCNRNRVDRQLKRYKNHSLPGNWGLGANGVMLRDLSDPDVQRINEMWWREFQRGVKRDQLSLMYCFWRLGKYPHLFSNQVFNRYFKWGKHGT